MPYRWEKPELVVDHNGVAIYHTYKDDMPSSFWYTLDSARDDWEDSVAFDVRELATYQLDLSHEDVLKAAIDSGKLQSPDEEE